MDRGSSLTRRALLAGAAAGLVVSGCSKPVAEPSAATPPGSPEPPDREAILLGSVIAAKEQMISLYRQTAQSDTGLAAALAPFEQRHTAHLAALRELMPAGVTPAASAQPATSPPATIPPATTAKASLAGLRDAERRAAAARAGQMADVSPLLAQLLASVGACEAVHALALGRVHD